MQFVAERRIENGLLSGLGFAACQSKNPQNPQSPKLPLYKEILRILTKLRKNERNTRKTSKKSGYLRKNNLKVPLRQLQIATSSTANCHFVNRIVPFRQSSDYSQQCFRLQSAMFPTTVSNVSDYSQQCFRLQSESR
jgi:hypothetical protein